MSLKAYRTYEKVFTYKKFSSVITNINHFKTLPQMKPFKTARQTQIVFGNQYVRARWTFVTNLVH